MKFARYLEDTQIPEWSKAYIDYRGLKKTIRRTQNASLDVSEQISNSSQEHHVQEEAGPSSRPGEPKDHLHEKQPPLLRRQTSSLRIQDQRDGQASLPNSSRGRGSTSIRGQSSNAQRDSRMNRSKSFSLRRNRQRRNHPQPFAEPLSLNTLLPLLSTSERAFFDKLDIEMDKIESFYLDREKEAQMRTKALDVQLRELRDHRRLVHSRASKSAWSSALNPKSALKAAAQLKPRRRNGSLLIHETEFTTGVPTSGSHHDTAPQKENPALPRLLSESKNTTGPLQVGAFTPTNVAQMDTTGEGHSEYIHEHLSLSLDEYQNAKKKLKKAVIEHYRVLEMLRNYRILNITGFRKALKKFEKVTKVIPAQTAYMTEKVDPSAIVSDKSVMEMINGMQNMYATSFAHGDKKKAMVALRAGAQYKSHHFSTFRSGMLMGLAIPALASGLYQSFQPTTRQRLEAWDALLFIYGILLVPTLLANLLGLNLLVYARTRINYLFIFEFDLRTRIDYREYFEIPSLLLATLCYAFWLSFTDIHSVHPTIWPLVWIAFAIVVIINPLPMQFKPSRYWLIRILTRLLLSGVRRVEFADFWMGDQLTSLVFTFSNLYLIPCVYVNGFNDKWKSCGASSHNWPAIFILAALPFFIRAAQSVKRYVDSGLVTHLINGGKYASGLVAYLLYFLWRHQGQTRGAVFALWCLFNAIYTIYACSWDFLMDWSIFRLKMKYPLLRPELVFSDWVSIYYFAIASNILLRFAWIIYIFTKSEQTFFVTFIVALLEMLRRWQWNFFRLENEHLGNVDQYRVSREVPLPYSFDDHHHVENDIDEEEDMGADS